MKKKIFWLLSFVFILTGCNVTYKLDYTNETVKETLIINDLKNYEKEVRDVYTFDLSTNYKDISDYNKEDGLANGYTYYDKKLTDENNLTLSYFYNFTRDKY